MELRLTILCCTETDSSENDRGSRQAPAAVEKWPSTGLGVGWVGSLHRLTISVGGPLRYAGRREHGMLIANRMPSTHRIGVGREKFAARGSPGTGRVLGFLGAG